MRKIISVFTAILTFFSFGFLNISPADEDCLLSCVIVSDTHIDEDHTLPWLPQRLLKNVLSDCSKSTERQDALVIVGDTTSHGVAGNWSLVEKCFGEYPDPADNILLAVGNHDTWSDNYENAISQYYKSSKAICGVERDKPYFSSDINGYKLIVMGSEGDSTGHPVISDAQLEWLDTELSEGTKQGNPVFVFNHEPLNGRHGLPITADAEEPVNPDPMDSAIGERSEEVEAILKKYDNVFFFSGHSHMGFCGEKTMESKGYASIEEEDGLVMVNLPSISCGNHHGETNRNCAGIVLEVYADKVVIRLRDFRFRTWIKSVALQDGKSCYEVPITSETLK